MTQQEIPGIVEVPPEPISEPIDEERQPLITPEDPAVSPLNVSKVHYGKVILNCTTFFSSIWFMLLLLSDFVSIPGMNNPGRSFLELNWLFIALFSSISRLLFFDVPSEIERMLSLVTSGIIGFDLLLLVLAHRRTTGAVGFLCCFWCLLSVLLTSLTEYLVEEGKINEEIRLTGRIDTRRTLKEWVVVLFRNCFKMVLLVYTVLISLNLLLFTIDTIRVKPWGELVKVEDNSFGLHLFCEGDVSMNSTSSQPILLLESGHDSNEEFSSWVQELYHLNKIDRYCIYDRPGYGFSDSSPSPVSISITADLLLEALNSKEINGPFQLISFDIGGLYSQVFATKALERVHSMLFVDSWHEDLLLRNPLTYSKKPNEKIPVEIARMRSIDGLRLWIRGFFSSTLGLGLQKSWLFKHRGSESRIFGDYMKYQGKNIRSRLQEQISASILSYHEVSSSKNLLSKVPVSIASSDFMIKKSLNWGNWQRQLTKLSTNTLEWKIIDGGHKLWENPKGKLQLQDMILRLLDLQ